MRFWVYQWTGWFGAFSGLDRCVFSVDRVVSVARWLWMIKEPGLYSMFQYKHILMLTKGLRKFGHCISPTVSPAIFLPKFHVGNTMRCTVGPHFVNQSMHFVTR